MTFSLLTIAVRVAQQGNAVCAGCFTGPRAFLLQFLHFTSNSFGIIGLRASLALCN